MKTAINSEILGGVSAATQELRLRCPQCGSFLGRLRDDEFPPEFLLSCTTCYFQMLNEDGIWRALPALRAEHFAQFISEYRTIREAEGRGSANAEYYLSLPYKDVSGNNQAQWVIRSKTYRFFERKILPEIERHVARDLNVLDLGAGNCWLSYRLSLRGHRPIAVDLLTSSLDGLGAAVQYQAKLPRLFPRFQAELNHLPFVDDQFDLAIFNASFHYSENYACTLGEAIRCLRPGGAVIVADTAWYSREESGMKMIMERRQAFSNRYGFPSEAIASMEYLTDDRLAELEHEFNIKWRSYTPSYGLRWSMRPWMAKLKNKREPSQFRIYVAVVNK